MPPAKRPYLFAVSDDQLETRPTGALLECLRYDRAQVRATDTNSGVPVGFTFFECENPPAVDRWVSMGIVIAGVTREGEHRLAALCHAWRAAHEEEPDRVDAFIRIRKLCFSLHPQLETNELPMVERILSFVRGLGITSENAEIRRRAVALAAQGAIELKEK